MMKLVMKPHLVTLCQAIIRNKIRGEIPSQTSNDNDDDDGGDDNDGFDGDDGGFGGSVGGGGNYGSETLGDMSWAQGNDNYYVTQDTYHGYRPGIDSHRRHLAQLTEYPSSDECGFCPIHKGIGVLVMR